MTTMQSVSRRIRLAGNLNESDLRSIDQLKKECLRGLSIIKQQVDRIDARHIKDAEDARAVLTDLEELAGFIHKTGLA